MNKILNYTLKKVAPQNFEYLENVMLSLRHGIYFLQSHPQKWGIFCVKITEEWRQKLDADMAGMVYLFYNSKSSV